MLELENAGLLRPAIYFFNMVGMPDHFTVIPRLSNEEKELYWVNESFTSDPTPTPRYYLYAENRIYTQLKGGQFGPTESPFILYKSYKSGYDSKKYTEQTLSDRINYAVTNRHLLFWARAGEATIMERLPHPYKIKIFGYHYAVDPTTKKMIEIENSKASSCNTFK